ncbi:MAG: ribosome biogenesis GTP-binding protein YihA/YsxC [Vicinamibacteria bacterium]
MAQRGNSPSVELVKTAGEPRDFPRAELPEVAAVGRSNVGKSSLLNSLFGVKRLAFVSKTPGRTQVVNFYRMGSEMVLVDLPGYGYAKVPASVRQKWDLLVTSYLFERETLSLAMLLVDVRREPMENDLQVRDLLERAGIPYVVVATKVDKLSRGRARGELLKLQKIYGAGGKIPIIPFSAVTNEGRKELWKTIENHARESKRGLKK